MGIFVIIVAIVSAVSWFVARQFIQAEEKRRFKSWENEAGSFIKLHGKD